MHRRHLADTALTYENSTATLQTGTGLHPELVREMHGTPDGFAANLESLKESATQMLDEFPQREAVVAHFDTLSPSIQSKVLRTLWQNPGISALDLMDRVEGDLTLAEQHEAEQWVRKLRGL